MSKPKDLKAEVEKFVAFLLEEDRTEALFEEANQLALELGFDVPVQVIRELKTYGVTCKREVPKQVRGFTSNNHNLWSDPSMKSHGGSGGVAIQGFSTEPGPFGQGRINGDSAAPRIEAQDRPKAYPYSRPR